MISSPASKELYCLLEGFRPFLKSLDMRTIAVRSPSDGEWENLVTSVVASEKTVDDVRVLHNNLPKIKSSQFALFLIAAPFDYTLFDCFERGKIIHGGLMVAGAGHGLGGTPIRTKVFNPLELKVTSHRRRMEGLLKYVLTATNLNSAPEREGLWDVAKSQETLVSQLSYESVEDLIKDTLRIGDISHNKDFELHIFDLGQIGNVTFSKSELTVEISKVAGLRNLQLNVTQGREEADGGYTTVWRKPFIIDEGAKIPIGQKYITKAEIQPPDLSPFDHITLKLIHRDSGLTMDESWKDAPLENTVEPFLMMLNSFCSIDKFRIMLFEPHDLEEPQRVFENAVTWLLSLAGFNTINLGRLDVLRSRSGCEVGSTDIIAYEESSKLLLVDCDIGPIDEKKIQRLIETGKHLSNSFEYHKKLEIIPVLATPKKYNSKPRKGVRIVDNRAMERILEELAKGYRDRARNIFSEFGY